MRVVSRRDARAYARRSNFPESFPAGVNWKYKLQIRDAGPGSILRDREAAGRSSRIVLKWAVAREVSQLCPERDAPTDQLSRFRLKSASLSLSFFLSLVSFFVHPDIPKEPPRSLRKGSLCASSQAACIMHRCMGVGMPDTRLSR